MSHHIPPSSTVFFLIFPYVPFHMRFLPSSPQWICLGYMPTETHSSMRIFFIRRVTPHVEVTSMALPLRCALFLDPPLALFWTFVRNPLVTMISHPCFFCNFWTIYRSFGLSWEENAILQKNNTILTKRNINTNNRAYYRNCAG